MAIRGRLLRRVARGMGTVVLLAHALTSGAVPLCTSLGYNNWPRAKTQKLYLYFPATADATFPSPGPAAAFDTTQLTSYTDSGTALIDAIVDEVTDIYCELNVEVLKTTVPVSAPAKRTVVAVGTDGSSTGTGQPWFGEADVNTGNGQSVEHARVWAGTYQQFTGSSGGQLYGDDSTVRRWAASIGGSIAHEAGHTYGADHPDGTVLASGEDAIAHHLMAAGRNFSFKDRALTRHFSDEEYETLASNVGLAVQTMFVWGLTNQNQRTAAALMLDILSVQPNLVLGPSYEGKLSPWTAPVLIPNGTYSFQSKVYYRYYVHWKTAQHWDSGQPGAVTTGTSFAIGTSALSVDPSTPDPLIVLGATLFDGEQSALPIRPRVPSLDAGDFDLGDGSFGVHLQNMEKEGALILASGSARMASRQLGIATLANADNDLDPFGRPVATRARILSIAKNRMLSPGARTRIVIARLAEGRRKTRIIRNEADCEPRETPPEGRPLQVCRPGINVSLFPETTTLLTVRLVSPKAPMWDSKLRKLVQRPLDSWVSYQLAGRHPDLDGNGIDDYIDIANGRARDSDRNGVPDHVQIRRR